MKSLEAATLALVDGIRAQLGKGVLPPAGYSHQIASSKPMVEIDGIKWLRAGVLAPAAEFPNVPPELTVLGASGCVRVADLTGVAPYVISAASAGNIGVYCTQQGQVHYTLDGGETFQRLAGRTATYVHEAGGYFYFTGSTNSPFRTADFVTIQAVTFPGLSSSPLTGIARIGNNYRAASSAASVDYTSTDGITFIVADKPQTEAVLGLVGNDRIIARVAAGSNYGVYVSGGNNNWRMSYFNPANTSTSYNFHGIARMHDHIVAITTVGNFATIDGVSWEFWGGLPANVDVTFPPVGYCSAGLIAIKCTANTGVALSNNGKGWVMLNGPVTGGFTPMMVGKYLILFPQNAASIAYRYEPVKLVGHPVYSDNTYYRVS